MSYHRGYRQEWFHGLQWHSAQRRKNVVVELEYALVVQGLQRSAKWARMQHFAKSATVRSSSGFSTNGVVN